MSLRASIWCRCVGLQGGGDSTATLSHLVADFRRRVGSRDIWTPKQQSGASTTARRAHDTASRSSAARLWHASTVTPPGTVELTMFKPPPQANYDPLTLDVVVPLSRQVDQRHTSAAAGGDNSTLSIHGPPSALLNAVPPAARNANATAPPQEVRGGLPFAVARIREASLCDSPLDHRSPTFDFVRSAAALGDWRQCVPLLEAAVESAQLHAASDAFEWSGRYPEGSLERRDASLRLLSFFSTTCGAFRSCEPHASEEADAAEKALSGVVQLLLQCAPCMPCLTSAPVDVRSRGYGHLARVASVCADLGLHGIVLSIDSQVIQPLCFSEEVSTRETPMTVGAAQDWHARVFRTLDTLHHSLGSRDDDEQDDMEQSAMPAAIALGIFRSRVEWSADDDADYAERAPQRATLPKGARRDPIGPTATALMVEMLQRDGNVQGAAEVMSHRALGRETRRELNRAYASLIEAWTATPAARRAREGASLKGDSPGSLPAPNWWRRSNPNDDCE